MSERGPRRSDALSRWWLLAAGALVVAAVALVTMRSADDVGNDEVDEVAFEPLVRRGSKEVAAPAPFEISDEPDGYRIVYRVQEIGLPVRSEVVEVARPFDARTTGYSEDDGEGSPVSLQEATLGRIAVGFDVDHNHEDDEDQDQDHDHADDEDDDHSHLNEQETGRSRAPTPQQRTVLAVGPLVAGPDFRLAPVLDEALARDLIEPREQREVLGRRCQVYRFPSSISGGVLGSPSEPGEYADACFDETGLLLEEWWVVDDDALRHRLALEVDEGAPAGLTSDLAHLTSLATSIPVDQGGGSARRMAPDSAPPGPFFVPQQPPAGFEHIGRYSVVPPQAEAFTDPEQRDYIMTSTADVWRRGIDVLVLDQGGTLGGVKPFEPAEQGTPVDLGPFGRGEALIGLGGNEVRVVRDPGRFVRIYGTLPTSELAAFAATLVETAGNEIVLIDEPPGGDDADDE